MVSEIPFDRQHPRGHGLERNPLIIAPTLSKWKLNPGAVEGAIVLCSILFHDSAFPLHPADTCPLPTWQSLPYDKDRQALNPRRARHTLVYSCHIPDWSNESDSAIESPFPTINHRYSDIKQVALSENGRKNQFFADCNIIRKAIRDIIRPFSCHQWQHSLWIALPGNSPRQIPKVRRAGIILAAVHVQSIE